MKIGPDPAGEHSEPAAYCWPQSVLPGEPVDLMVTAAGPITVEVVRRGRDDRRIARIQDIASMLQPTPKGAEVAGCGWEPTVTLDTASDWTSGFYLVRVTDSAGTSCEAFFVVRASTPGKALLVLSTSTWAAYNDWGGPNFYTGSHHTSLERPLPRGFLDKPDPSKYRVARFRDMSRADARTYFESYSYWSAASGFANWERLFVAWAEENGLALDYATSTDLAFDPDLLTPYSLYLSVGHDEYWSASMRDHVESWIDAGGLAAFLSGNTAFWQVRFENDRTMTSYKFDWAQDPLVGTDQEHLVATMWSDPLSGRPESEMTGVSFTRGGYAQMRNAPQGTGGYTVHRSGHWAFADVPVRRGDVVGADPPTVGYECDGCDLTMINGLPTAAGTGGTPANFEVLATAPAHLWTNEELDPGLPGSYIGELNWVAERIGGADTAENRERFTNGHAVMGTYTRGAGEVFTTGCTDWAYGLSDPVVSQITRNVIGRRVALDHKPTEND